MALINSDQLQALAESIVPIITDPSGAQTKERNIRIVDLKTGLTTIMQYIVDNMEVKGVKVTTGLILHAPPGIVTPADGGATLYASDLFTQLNSVTINQNNDGTGLVE